MENNIVCEDDDSGFEGIGEQIVTPLEKTEEPKQEEFPRFQYLATVIFFFLSVEAYDVHPALSVFGAIVTAAFAGYPYWIVYCISVRSEKTVS